MDRGPSFAVLLTLLFIGLKLAGIITWPWIWVLAPFWVSVVLGTIALMVLVWLGDSR